MKNSECFKTEINYIFNDTLRKIVEETLDAAPDYIQTIPASSTGKYHPSYSLGEGGLMRHVQAAVRIARSLCQTDNFKNIVFKRDNIVNDADFVNKLQMYRDCAYAALILHDCRKADDTPKHNTRFDHPLLAAKLFKETAKKYITNDNLEYMKVVIPLVYNAIASHMGEWNTASYMPNVTLPKPACGLDDFVHLCDYLGSRRFLEFDFVKFDETGR